MKVKVCAAQMTIDITNIQSNLDKSETIVREAKERGCDFVCLCEDSVTGAMSPAIEPYIQSIPGMFSDHFSGLARKYAIHIIPGSFPERRDGNLYNTSMLIDDRGAILGTYSKIHLWNGESLRITPGDTLPVFETRWGRVGLMICWDLAFPEITRELALKGAGIIFCPTLWSDEDRFSNLSEDSLRKRVPDVDTEGNFVRYCAAARAMENGVFLVLANACGNIVIRGVSHRNFGNSLIAAPFHGIVSRLDDREGLLVEELDLSLLDLAEEVYRIRREIGAN